MRKQTKLAVVVSAAALLALGASMTSFAAGWDMQDGEWVYLDKDGDRVYDTWKKSNGNYYYLNEDGVMATDTLIEYEENYYYVDENGVKVTNRWVEFDNEDDEQVGAYDDVNVLWYYFGSTGKAVVDDEKVIGGKKYIFNEEGRAISGWYEDADGNLYYLGTEDECWAYTGWQQIEPDDTLPMFAGLTETDAYDAEKWFYFRSNGKAYKNAKKYIGGQYYSFDNFGRMNTKWKASTPAAPTVGSSARYEAADGYLQRGWVYTYDPTDGPEEKSEYWFYLDRYGVPFNYQSAAANTTGGAIKKDIDKLNGWDDKGTGFAAKIIKGKTYLFNTTGQMQTGVFQLDDVTRVGSTELLDGVYYFDKTAGSNEGAMVTGKETITYDGDEFSYYFQKNGKAYQDTIADGSFYDAFGEKVIADDGNNYMVVEANELPATIAVKNSADITVDGEGIIVSASGKVKKSGSVKIDGVKYEVDGYQIISSVEVD